MIEDGGVEAALLPDVCAGLLKGSFRRGGHVLDYQVLTIDNRVVFADVVRKLLKMITTRVGDLLVEHSDFLLLFFQFSLGGTMRLRRRCILASCGGAPLEKLKAYIESQNRPD